MKAVIQRVSCAHVNVNEQIVGKISGGLLVLLGITHDDTDADIDYLIRKTTQMRIFNDENGVMNRSVIDISGQILIVSQFTLYADTRKGSRPSYIQAAKTEQARLLYETFIAKLREAFSGHIATGIFGADMKVSLVNDGPVTIIIDSSLK